MLFNIIEKSKVSSTNLQNKLQFVNSVKRLVFDLTKIPFLKRLISIPRLMVEVLNDQNLFTKSNLANWISSYVPFCSGLVEWKMNHLKFLIVLDLCPKS